MDSKTQFEKWFNERFENLNVEPQIYAEFEKAKSNMKYGFMGCQELNDKRIAELEKILSFEEPYLITILDEIRSAIGGTDKLMLYQLAPEITKRIAELESRLKVAIKALEHIAIKDAKDGQAKYAIAKQALKQLTE